LKLIFRISEVAKFFSGELGFGGENLFGYGQS
jgi:hypothetical protein